MEDIMNTNKNLDKETIKQYLRNNFERIFNEYIEKEQKERNYFKSSQRVSYAECCREYGSYHISGTILDLNYSDQRLDADVYRNCFNNAIEEEIQTYLEKNEHKFLSYNRFIYVKKGCYSNVAMFDSESDTIDCHNTSLDLDYEIEKDDCHFTAASMSIPIKVQLNLSQLDIDKLSLQAIYGDYTDNKKLSKDLEYYDYCLDEKIEFDKEEDECVKELLERKVTYETIDEQIINWFLSRYWGKTETDADFFEIFGFEPDEEIEFDYEIKEEDDYLTLYINSKNN